MNETKPSDKEPFLYKRNHFDLNIPFHFVIVFAGFCTVSLGLVCANTSITRFTQGRQADIQLTEKSNQLDRDKTLFRSEIEAEREETQAKIDNNINVFDSVTLTGYTCDPKNPPDFDPKPFVDYSSVVNVSDENQIVIGYISFTGQFFFEPENCTNKLNRN